MVNDSRLDEMSSLGRTSIAPHKGAIEVRRSWTHILGNLSSQLESARQDLRCVREDFIEKVAKVLRRGREDSSRTDEVAGV
jgi:hypothetical protein